MMSLPDFREKQLLIIHARDISTDGLQFNNENICLKRDGVIVNQLSCYKVLALWIIGDCTITTVLIKQCHQYGVSLFLLKDNFQLYSALVASADGNYLLRSKQYTQSRDFEIAKHIVLNKTLNQQFLLLDVKTKTRQNEIQQKITTQLESIHQPKELLGFEGSQTKQFFKTYFAEMNWRRRLPRTKYDEINTLMDIGYTFLFNYMDALLALYGFDPYKGVYHTLFFQRKSLACDLMEPFRCIIEKAILKSYHLKQIDKKDFKIIKGKYTLSYDKQKKYVSIFSQAIMDQKEDVFCYVRDYYYCILNDTADYPLFTIY